MKSISRGLAFLIALVAAGCGSAGSPQVVPNTSTPSHGSLTANRDPACPPTSNDPFCASPPPGATSAASARINTRKGGTLTLADGSSITLSAGSLAHSTIVRAALVPQPNETPPSQNFTPIGPMLQLSVSTTAAEKDGTSTAPADTSGLSVSFRFHQPPTAIRSTNARSRDIGGAAVAQFILPIARIYDLNDKTRYVDVPIPFQVDQTTGDATASLSGYPAFLIPGAQVATFFVLSKIADTPCGAQGRFNPGLRYYDPNTRLWQAGAPPNVPTHPLLLEHGLLSCVEDTFPPALIERYRADGAYDFIIGYDYDWFKNPTDIAPQIKSAVDQFGFQHLDVFAHSYGTINVLATIPTLAPPTQVDNLVLYDGPLDGALIADRNVYLGELAAFDKLSIATGTLEGATLGAAGQAIVNNINKNNMIYQQGNLQLKGIIDSFEGSQYAAAHVIKLTGGSPVTFDLFHIFKFTAADIYKVATGHFPLLQNDGIVTTDSATTSLVYGKQPPNSIGPDDVIDKLDKSHIFKFATHTTIFSSLTDAENPGQSFQATTEGFIAPNLSFVFDNSDTGSGVYPSTGAGVVMKGIHTREHFYAINACFADHFSVISLADNSYLDYQPKAVIPISNCASTSGFTYAVTSNPPNVLATSNGQASPTTRSTLQASDDFGNAINFGSDFFILPDCSSCITASSPRISTVNRRKATQRIDAVSTGVRFSTKPNR